MAVINRRRSTGSKMETVNHPGNVWQVNPIRVSHIFFIFLIGDPSEYFGIRCGCYQSCCQALWENWKDGVGATNVHMSSLFAMSQLAKLRISARRKRQKLPEASVKHFFYEFGDFLVKV